MSFHFGTVDEDGSYSALGRVVSLDGSGAEYVGGEGNALRQADVASIACKVYALGTNRDSEAGTEVTPAPTVVVASSVFDTLRRTGWKVDRHGYNFRHDLGPEYAPAPGEWYLIEYRFTLASGAVAWAKFKVKTVATRAS